MLTLVHTAPVQSVELDLDPGTTELDPAGGAGLWSDQLAGLLVVSQQGSLYLVKLDGAAVRLSRTQGWRGLGYEAVLDRPIVSLIAGAWTPVELPATKPLAPSTPNGYPSIAALADRVLRYSFGRVRGGPPGGPDEVEAVVRNGVPEPGVIAPAMARPCSRWWCLSVDGWADLYDSSTHEILASTKLDPGWLAAGYSRKHNVFATVSPDRTLRVYANDPATATVTAPVFSTPPARGGVRKLSARVLGAHGEPCAGHVLQFAVSAGSVDPITAETDATGAASVTYRAPLVAQSDVLATATLDEG